MSGSIQGTEAVWPDEALEGGLPRPLPKTGKNWGRAPIKKLLPIFEWKMILPQEMIVEWAVKIVERPY